MCADTGYLAYFRTSARGLVNQGWKDSGDCIVDRQGKDCDSGRSTLCEVQAYVYAAKIRMSELAKIRQENELATRWQQEAQSLRQRFDRDFWIPDRDFLAMALDGAGKRGRWDRFQSRTMSPAWTSSIQKKPKVSPNGYGHPICLAAGGFGLSAVSQPAYNPIGYHTGSVWPHDNSLITMGLRSVGAVEQALEVAQGIFDMTVQQPYHRPPGTLLWLRTDCGAKSDPISGRLFAAGLGYRHYFSVIANDGEFGARCAQ